MLLENGMPPLLGKSLQMVHHCLQNLNQILKELVSLDKLYKESEKKLETTF
jgi:hypothetical protein